MPETIEIAQNLAAALVVRLRELHRERPTDERVQAAAHSADDVVRMLADITAEPLARSVPMLSVEMA
jgi:hypothetical protein